MATQVGSIERKRQLAQLESLCEEGSYFAYVDSFMSIVNQVDLPEEDQVTMFVKGLKEGSTKLIQVLNPKTLQQAIAWGRALTADKDPYERKGRTGDMMVSLAHPVSWPNAKQGNSNSGSKTWEGVSKGPEPGNTSMVVTNRNSAYLPSHRRFTNAKIDEEQTRGSCLWCDVDFANEHQCAPRKLYPLVLEQTEEVKEGAETALIEPKEEQEAILSLHELHGINMRVAKQLGGASQRTTAQRAIGANGDRMSGNAIITWFIWTIQDKKLEANMLLMSIRGWGRKWKMKWVNDVGIIKWDFHNWMKQFQWGKEQDKLTTKEENRRTGKESTLASSQNEQGLVMVQKDIIEKLVLQLWQDKVLIAKFSKCSFACKKIEYLGHYIEENGVSTESRKIEAVQTWSTQKHIKQWRWFLGMTGYYLRSVKGYGATSKSLTSLLKKNFFGWNEQTQSAFDMFKTVMMSTPSLGLPDFTEGFILGTDASDRKLGAGLMQERHTIVLTEKGMHYLLGRHLIIKAAHQSLKSVLEQCLHNDGQFKWISKLMGVDYEFCYRKGKDKIAANTLSRIQGLELIAIALSVEQGILLDDKKNRWTQDSYLKFLIEQLKVGQPSHFIWKHNLLLRNGKIVEGSSEELMLEIIRIFHALAASKHLGVNATIKRIVSFFYGEGLEKDGQRFIQTCEMYSRCKGDNSAYPRLLQPLPIPTTIGSVGDKYGHTFPILIPYILGSTTNKEAEQVLGDRETMWKLLLFHLHRAQHKRVQMATEKRARRNFQVNGYVFVELQPYKQGSVGGRGKYKLSTLYFCYYKILDKTISATLQAKYSNGTLEDKGAAEGEVLIREMDWREGRKQQRGWFRGSY